MPFSHWSRRLFTRYHRELQEAQENLRIAAIAFESQEGEFPVTDTRGIILRVNSAFTEITGYSAEAIGRTPALLKSGRHDSEFYAAAMQATLATTGAWSGNLEPTQMRHVFPEWLTITAVKTDAGEVTHYVSALTDITKQSR